MIERNKHAAGRISNVVFGLATFLDGAVRVLSLGFLHTRLPVEVSKIQAKRIMLRQLKKNLRVAAKIDAQRERIEKGLKKMIDGLVSPVRN